MSKQLASLLKTIRKAQEQAASLELTLNNGALVDSLLGSIADELECERGN